MPLKVALADFAPLSPVLISAKEGAGTEELKEAIFTASGAYNLKADVAVLTTERQRDCANRAYSAVCEALSTMEDGFTLDAVGICADDALSALLELSGERVTEAVTNEVFSRFCVGK